MEIKTTVKYHSICIKMAKIWNNDNPKCWQRCGAKGSCHNLLVGMQNASPTLTDRASQVALVVKNPPANAGDVRDAGLISELGRPAGGGHGDPLQCSCLENPHGQRSLGATVHSVTKSWTWLKWLITHALWQVVWWFFYKPKHLTIWSASPGPRYLLKRAESFLPLNLAHEYLEQLLFVVTKLGNNQDILQ